MKTNFKVFLVIVSVLVLAGLLYSLVESPGAAPTRPITIGVIAPLTGPVATIGQYMREGLTIAEEEIKEQGGIQGRPFQLLYEDTIADPKLSVTAVQRLINLHNARVIIGDYRSPNTLAVAPIVEAAEVILISPGSQADKLSTAGDFIFRTQVTAESEAKKLADFLVIERKVKEVSSIVTDQDYGISFEQKFSVFFEQQGGKVLSKQRVATDEKDYGTILLKIKASNTDTVVLAVGGLAGGLIARQAQELGLSLHFVASSIIQTEDLLNVGKNAVEGLVYVYPYDEASQEKTQQEFRQRYRERFGKENDVIAANSYDALMLAAGAMGSCGEETECIKEWLYDVQNYQGASGILSFDQNGDVKKPLTVKVVQNGKFAAANY